MKITIQMLRSKKACDDQVDLFHQLFGEEVVLTKEIVMEHGHKFNLSWFVGAFMDRSTQDAYYAAIQPHRDAYHAAVKPHRDAYDAAIQPHWDAYNAAIIPHWDTYETAIKPHKDAYNAAFQPHRDVFLKARSEVFWNAISSATTVAE